MVLLKVRNKNNRIYVFNPKHYLGSCCTDDTPRTLPSELNNYNSICRDSSNKMSSYDKELLATQSNR